MCQIGNEVKLTTIERTGAVHSFDIPYSEVEFFINLMCAGFDILDEYKLVERESVPFPVVPGVTA